MADPIQMNVGDQKVATVVGFDQFGQPFPIDFAATPASWSVSDPAVLSSSPNPDGSDSFSALASGSASLDVSVAGFSDSLPVTVAQAAAVLSSVKIVVS